jgi:predicted RNA-binding protein Jag
MTRTERQAQRYALPGEGPTDEDLEHEIELTRRELSETVAELVQRMDVKARVEQATQRQADRVRLWARQRRTPLIATSGGVVLAVTALLIVLIRRR